MTSKAFLAIAGVALVILVDLATGQGPPIYANYLRGQQESQMMSPPAPPMIPMQAHMIPVQYEQPIDYAAPANPRLDIEEKEAKNKFESDGYEKEAKHKFESGGYEKEAKNKFESGGYEKEAKEEERNDKYKYNKEEDVKTTKSPGLYDRIMKNFG